jgi:hypothetical protein
MNNQKKSDLDNRIKSDFEDTKIWYMDILDFVSFKNLHDFFPNNTQTKIEQLNSIFRFSLYLSILFYFYNRNENVFIIPFLVGIYTLVSYNVYTKSVKYDYFSNRNNYFHKNTREPTINNPFMNPNLIIHDDNNDTTLKNVLEPNTQKHIQNLFNKTTVQDSYDLFDRNNANQRFYTVPSTTIPNRQGDFANFLYGDMKSRKEVIEY